MTTESKYLEYIKRNRTHYKDKSIDRAEAVFGLISEVGEYCSIYQKILRGERTVKLDIKSELGDILYYLTTVAANEGFTLKELRESNKQKLIDRGWDK